MPVTRIVTGIVVLKRLPCYVNTYMQCCLTFAILIVVRSDDSAVYGCGRMQMSHETGDGSRSNESNLQIGAGGVLWRVQFVWLSCVLSNWRVTLIFGAYRSAMRSLWENCTWIKAKLTSRCWRFLCDFNGITNGFSSAMPTGNKVLSSADDI